MNKIRKLARAYVEHIGKSARENGIEEQIATVLTEWFFIAMMAVIVSIVLFAFWQIIGVWLLLVIAVLLLMILGAIRLVEHAEASAEKSKNDDRYDPYSEGRFGALAEDFEEFEAVIRQKREDAQHDT